MKLIQYTTLCLFAFSFFIGTSAQNVKNANSSEKKDSLRIAKVKGLRKFREGLFVEKLHLSDAEKTNFFLIYDGYQLKLREAKVLFRARWKDKEMSSLSDADAEKYFNDAIVLRKTEVQLMETYTNKLKPVIGMNRALQLPKIEREIKKEMIAKARGIRKTNNAENNIDTAKKKEGKKKRGETKIIPPTVVPIKENP